MTKLETKLRKRIIMLEEQSEQILSDIKWREKLTAHVIIHEAGLLKKIDNKLCEIELMLAD